MLELIVRYTGDLQSLSREIGFTAEELLGGYAILSIEEERAPQLLAAKEIIWTELPARVYTEAANERREIGVTAVQARFPDLTGKGVYVAIIDSGIDFSHPDFCNADGTTRIEALWDQTARAEENGAGDAMRPPEGYRQGVLYTREQINAALQGKGAGTGESSVPEQDLTGHGTHVAGIAAGNGRASQGRYRGVAYESTLLVVKLAGSQTDPFPQTTNLMTAVDFCVRYAAERGVPLAVNLSFGNQEGAHDGQSLLETYLDEATLYGRNVICIGTGNDAALGRHAGGRLRGGEEQEQILFIGNGERRLRFGIWLSSLDSVMIDMESPTGTVRQLVAAPGGSGVAVKGYPVAGGQVFAFGTTTAEVFFGQATPYRQLRQTEIVLRGDRNGEIETGGWRIRLRADAVLDGEYDIWLSSGVASTLTRFQTPLADRTLTIPSTAARGIAVAAYNSLTGGITTFSGRGFPRNAGSAKPDLAAPGVDIVSCAPGGGYTAKTGTSMATPFVTGGAALLLQWGIVLGNDPYLYGERLKSFLLYGTVPLAGLEERPNRLTGYGRLNLENTFREL